MLVNALCSEKLLFLYEIFQIYSNNQKKERKINFYEKSGAALVRTITSNIR